MQRRTFLGFFAAGLSTSLTGCFSFWPDEGFLNPCLPGPLPAHLAQHDWVKEAWQGIDSQQFWDCHVHLIGLGDSNSGIWVNPAMKSVLHPIQHTRFKFFLNGSCVNEDDGVDAPFVIKLAALHNDLPNGVKLMLLAFDHNYDETGKQRLDRSAFYVPNEYAAKIAAQHPQRFEWIASIHPYRKDCIDALKQAIKSGTRAIKWLPSAMGMDPASPLCDRFYEALKNHNIPLLTHAGDEHAVESSSGQQLGNPLRLRRALDHGVRVIVAHGASQGNNIDTDKGPNAKPVDNFELFSRLMDEPRYEKLAYGDISAMPQTNRVGSALDTMIKRQDWHHRLINGSDYPLPGVMPLFSLKKIVERGMFSNEKARLFSEVRRYNPLLFDFLVKRHMQSDGLKFSASVFETRKHFIQV